MAGSALRWLRKNIWAALLLVAVYLGTGYVVKRYKRPGQMSVIEAQAMDMNAMKAPTGYIPVETEIARAGSFTPKVTYTGTVVAYTDQDIYPRVVGRIIEMPVYPGDRVKAGQSVARLDTAELGAREETASHAYRAAQEEAGMSRAELRRSRTMRSEARARLSSAQNGLKEARHQLEAGREEQEEARAELAAAQGGVEEAQADVRMNQADADYWRSEIRRMEALLKSGAVSQEEFERERASAQAAEAKVRQSQAKVRQMEADVRSVQSRIRKAQSNIAAMTAKVAQMESEVDMARSALQGAEAEIDAAARKVGSSQAMADQSRSAWRETAVVKGYANIATPVGGVVTSRLVSPGVLVSPGTPILRIAETRRVRLQANVAERDRDRILPGNAVWVRDMNSRKAILQAKVTSVFPSADPVARTAIVEAVVENPGMKFIPGQYIVLDIATGQQTETVSAPNSAIVYTSPRQTGVFFTEKRPSVWMVRESKSGKTEYYCPMHPEVVSDKPGVCPKCNMNLEPREKAAAEKTEYYCTMHPEVVSDKPGLCPKCNMKLEPRTKGGSKRARLAPVTLGESDGRRTVILTGINAGDEIIVRGHDYLKEGDAVSTNGETPPPPATPPTMESFHKGHGGSSSGSGKMSDMPGM
ncbi:MAG: efflux RND transporter periplasmic adaptor subunit [Armatimonadetes bacterium]|nr:efflux RND transporter periplasmic adaptor subunit [Armatimonadota bacterium]